MAQVNTTIAAQALGGPTAWTTYSYDQTDSLPSGTVSYDEVTDALGHVTRTYKDVLGRVVRTVYDDGSFTQALSGVGTDAVSGHTVAGQTISGRQETRIDQMGRATDNFYDASGRLTDVWLPAVLDADPDSPTYNTSVRPHWQYTYDANGNQTEQIDPKLNETRFEYDELNRRTKRTLPIGVSTASDPNDFVEQSQYDAFGRQKLQISFEGKVIQFQYADTGVNAGRLMHKRMFADLTAYNNGAGTADQTVDYTYDPMGRVATISDSVNGSWSYAYDAQGQQTSVTSPVGTIRYEYDPATGWLTRTYTGLEDTAGASVAGDGKAITDTRYDYDSMGRLSTVCVYERNDTPLATPETTEYGYDAVGDLDWIKQSNGITSDYVYDDLNRLKELTHFVDGNADHVYQAGETVKGRYVYDLADDGNRTKATETDDLGQSIVFNWIYDADGRLIGETYDGPDAAHDYIAKYEFDLNGNRITKKTDEAATGADIAAFVASGGATFTSTPEEIVTGTFDADDRLLTEVKDRTGTTEDTNTVFGYGTGNSGTAQTSKEVRGGTTIGSGAVQEQHSFEYDAQGRMSSATVTKDGITHTMTYKYGDDGIRIEQSINDGTATETHKYLIDPNNLTGYAQVLEEIINNVLAKTFTIGQDVLSQHDATNGTLTLLADGHGSTRLLADVARTVLQRFMYGAYGELLAGPNLTSSAMLTDILYSGEQTDRILGMQYLRDRYYDWLTGRMGRFDKYGGNNADPRSFHKYLFTPDNPINFNDPSGMMWTQGGILTTTTIIGSIIGTSIGVGIATYKGYKVTEAKFWGWTLGGALAGAAVGYVGGLALIKLGLISVAGAGAAAPKIDQAAEEGYQNAGQVLNAWKEKLGTWSSDLNLHHLVEQGGQNASRFPVQAIQSIPNTTPIPSGMHQMISNMYSSGPNLLQFMQEDSNMRTFSTLRQWMQTQSWEVQWRWGYFAYTYVVQHGNLEGFSPEKYGL